MTVKHIISRIPLAFLFTVFALAGTSTADAKMCETAQNAFHEFNCPFVTNPGSDEGDDDAPENDADDGELRQGPMTPPMAPMNPDEDEDEDGAEAPPRRR